MSTVISKQPEISSLFTHLIQEDYLQHAYIFEGVAGTGKYEMAKWVAQGLFCQNITADGNPCLECNQCVRIQAEEHPDVIILEPDGASIKVDQVRAIKDEFSKSGMETRKKILIVKAMDKMTTSAANSILKFIEEPEGEITIFLLTTEVQQLLPTIISRSQTIHFPVRDINSRISQIVEQGASQTEASLLAYLTQDTDEAMEILNDDNFKDMVDAVWQWFLLLNKRENQAFIYVQTDLMPLSDSRDTAALMLDLLILIYRDLTALCFDQERVLAFSKYEKELKQIATRSAKDDLAHILQTILNGEKKLRRYVSAQGVFEQISLNIINEWV